MPSAPANTPRARSSLRVLRSAFPLFLLSPFSFLLNPTFAQSPAPSPAPSTAPSTAPTTQEAPALPPPGFIEIASSSGTRAVWCRAEDEPWVRPLLADDSAIPPARRPTTMPSDLVTTLTSQRDSFIASLAADTNTTPEQTTTFFDDRLLPTLTRLRDLRYRITYLVTTRPVLVEALKAGWTHPRFSYNRFADDVMFNMTLTVSDDATTTETLIPALWDPTSDTDPASRRAKLLATIAEIESGIAASIAERGLTLLQAQLITFSAEIALPPLNLKPDQEWLGIGMVGVVAAKHASAIAGVPRDRVIAAMTMERPNAPVRASRINVLQLTPAAELRDSYRRPYADAVRRRAIAIIHALTQRGGEDALPRSLAAVKATPPADGPALVTLIRTTTGIDLTDDITVK